jgi:hypothetical protein
METSALSALLRNTRSAAKAVALPSLLCLGTAAAVFLPTESKALVPVAFFSCEVTPTGNVNPAPPPDTIPITNCPSDGVQLGDKFISPRFDLFARDPQLAPGQTGRPVSILFNWQDTDGLADQDFSDDVWNLSVGDPNGIAFSGPITLSYGYDIFIQDGPLSPLPPVPFPPRPNPGLVCDTTSLGGGNNCDFVADSSGWYFDSVSLDTDSPAQLGPTRTVKVSAQNIIPGVGPVGEFFNLTSITGTPDGPEVFAGNYKKITIQDTVEIPANSGIISVSNTWKQRTSVPGPLPLVGAGIAFGFSRRLKKRIKTALA